MSSEAGPTPVAVFGAGHLGTFHARIWAGHPDAKLVGVVDSDADRARVLAKELDVAAATSVDELPEPIEIASVAVPTAFHDDVAVPLLERGVACLVEKPLAQDVESADRILAAAEAAGATLSVGHVERFQPALRKVREIGLAPRFIECHRLAPFSFRSTDIGVVHDLMIHDIDLILDLMHDVPLESFDATGGAILTEHEDVASVRLVFANGARANISANRVSMTSMRRFRTFSKDSYASLDFQKNYGVVVKKGPNWDEGLVALKDVDPKLLAVRPDFIQDGMIETVELQLGEEERPLQAELDSFLQAVRNGRPPEVTGDDGRRALELADRIAAAIREQTW